MATLIFEWVGVLIINDTGDSNKKYAPNAIIKFRKHKVLLIGHFS